MTMDEGSSRALPAEVTAWLERLGRELPAGTLEAIGSPELQAAILDLARVAAHRSARMAAPLSTYLAAVAFASLPPADRVGRIRDLVTRLDVDP